MTHRTFQDRIAQNELSNKNLIELMPFINISWYNLKQLGKGSHVYLIVTREQNSNIMLIIARQIRSLISG